MNKKDRGIQVKTANISNYYASPKTCECCNKNLKYEQRRSRFCSRNCAAQTNNKTRSYKWITEEWKRKQSIKMKATEPAGWRIDPKFYREKTKQTVALNKHKFYITTCCAECAIKFNHLKSQKRKYCSHTCAYKNNYHQNSTKLYRCIYKNYKMDSGAEFLFAKILDENNIIWIKNSKTFFEYHYQNKTKKYYPDFYLPDYKLWVEIKGKKYIEPWLPNKLQSVKNITLIYSSELKDKIGIIKKLKTESTRLELAAFRVTGECSDQLSYNS